MRPAFRKVVIRKVVATVAFSLALGLAETASCPTANASYGFNDALGTIGISAGIGAVIGLSTISFYSSPTQHFSNALIGAGAGLVLGIGVAAYLMSNASESNEINPDDVLPAKQPQKAPPGGSGGSGKPGTGTQWDIPLRPRALVAQILTSVPAALAMRETSDWTLSLRVLELRF